MLPQISQINVNVICASVAIFCKSKVKMKSKISKDSLLFLDTSKKGCLESSLYIEVEILKW
jgi:hypothetical protein